MRAGYVVEPERDRGDYSSCAEVGSVGFVEAGQRDHERWQVVDRDGLPQGLRRGVLASLDATALHVYTQAEKELLPLQMLYNLNKATCDELLGEADMGAVFALPSSASWADVSDELMRITSGSRFGMKALGFARLLAQSALMGRVLTG